VSLSTTKNSLFQWSQVTANLHFIDPQFNIDAISAYNEGTNRGYHFNVFSQPSRANHDWYTDAAVDLSWQYDRAEYAPHDTVHQPHRSMKALSRIEQNGEYRNHYYGHEDSFIEEITARQVSLHVIYSFV
jgi:hypothetical protein